MNPAGSWLTLRATLWLTEKRRVATLTPCNMHDFHVILSEAKNPVRCAPALRRDGSLTGFFAALRMTNGKPDAIFPKGVSGTKPPTCT